MKKSVTIHISGIIFHIEEDAYGELGGYLESVNRYFSTYEDSSEILADIESRIAEIFLSKLSDQKQVLTLADVNALMATMGKVADFEAAEELQGGFGDDSPDGDWPGGTGTATRVHKQERRKKGKKLFRDLNKKLLGGVSAGLAHYMGLDPIWVRLAFLLMFFDVFNTSTLGSAILLLYCIAWAVVPGSKALGEDKRAKKFFRDRENGEIAGVCTGMGKYFGVDVNLLRVLFVVGIFLGGTGLLIYWILWAITPEAKTLTERMQMEGEPVTLGNIEKRIKEGLDLEDEDGEESLLAKILLFPFRVVSAVIGYLSKDLKPVFAFLIVLIPLLAGIMIVATSLGWASGLMVSAAVYLGVGAGLLNEELSFIGYADPAGLLPEIMPPLAAISLFAALFLPAILMGLAGASIIARRSVASPAVRWVLFGTWLGAISASALTIAPQAHQFSQTSFHNHEQVLTVPDGTLTLNLASPVPGFGRPELTILGHDAPHVLLETKFQAQGKNREEAFETAQKGNYQASADGNKISLAALYSVEAETPFRFQRAKARLYIPYGTEFEVSPELSSLLHQHFEGNGFASHRLEGKRWTYTVNGLKCTNCDGEKERPLPPGPSVADSLD